VQHRGQQRVGDPVAGDVDDRDASRALAALQVLDHVDAPPGRGLGDAGVEVEPLLEVDVDDVVAAADAVER